MKKLVRDLIPSIIQKSGRTPRFYQASNDEFLSLLKSKLLEEAHEFIESENIEEIADILEVIEALIEAYRFDKKNVEKIKESKSASRGKFCNRIVLVTSN